MATKAKPPAERKAPGVIRADEVYTLAEFYRRSGIGEYGMRKAKRRGLRVVKVGSRTFVRGRDFVEFVDQQNNGATASR